MMTSETTAHTPQGAHEALAKAFGHLRLDHVLFGLNDACRNWSSGMMRSELHALKNSEPGHPIMYWLAAETARHAMTYCMRPSVDSPIILRRADEYRGWETIERLIDLAVDIQLHVPVEPMSQWQETLTTDLWGAMGQIWLRQYILQRRSPYRTGQALLMYSEAPKRRARRDTSFSLSAYD